MGRIQPLLRRLTRLAPALVAGLVLLPGCIAVIGERDDAHMFGNEVEDEDWPMGAELCVEDDCEDLDARLDLLERQLTELEARCVAAGCPGGH